MMRAVASGQSSGQWSVVSDQHAQAYFSSSSRRRSGITLLEVLISMGVLLIGLMGVGAMIPAGRYEIMQGVKTDYATTVGRAAFRDLKARGYLNPRSWNNGGGTVYTPGTTPSSPIPGPFSVTIGGPYWPCVAIDPLGILATPTFGPEFPYYHGPVHLTRVSLWQVPDPTLIQMTKQVGDSIFRCPDDLVTVPDYRKDMPPWQQMIPFNPAPWTVAPGSSLTRSSEANYSWLATIVTDPNSSAMDAKVNVSVAVFYKRDLSSAGAKENSATVQQLGVSDFRLDLSAAPAFQAGLRPGQWIMLAGPVTVPNPIPPPGTTLTIPVARWYRTIGAAKVNPVTQTQDITLAGADWNPLIAPIDAWLFDGVIAVYEKNMRLELE
jgi:hypothetical protein